MVLLKNIAVSILADGEQLPEYVDAEHTTTQISNTVSRYVKTVPGAELMIKYESLLPEDHRYMHQQEPHHPCLVFQFYLNGRWVGFRLLDHETRTSIFRAILWLPEDTMVLSTLNFSENTFCAFETGRVPAPNADRDRGGYLSRRRRPGGHCCQGPTSVQS